MNVKDLIEKVVNGEDPKDVLQERVDVSTTAYQRSHAKNPQGTGLWVFGFDREENDFEYTGPHKVALAAAKKAANKAGAFEVVVMP